MSACSSYFKKLLLSNPCKHPTIIMPQDVCFNDLKFIIEFVYKGEIDVSQAELQVGRKKLQFLSFRDTRKRQKLVIIDIRLDYRALRAVGKKQSRRDEIFVELPPVVVCSIRLYRLPFHRTGSEYIFRLKTKYLSTVGNLSTVDNNLLCKRDSARSLKTKFCAKERTKSFGEFRWNSRSVLLCSFSFLSLFPFPFCLSLSLSFARSVVRLYPRGSSAIQ